MSQAVFAGLPIFIVYLFFQKHIVSAVAGTASLDASTRPVSGSHRPIPGMAFRRNKTKEDNMAKKQFCKSALALLVGALLRQAPMSGKKTEITFPALLRRLQTDYGKVVDGKARGECGIITALTNQFNATNKEGIVVKTQIAEWGPYYDQLTARIVAKDIRPSP